MEGRVEKYAEAAVRLLVQVIIRQDFNPQKEPVWRGPAISYTLKNRIFRLWSLELLFIKKRFDSKEKKMQN